jgi:nucleotide-binding universal stress UspA family protein
MKIMIIATDYSKAADNALEYAAALARHSRAKLVIFNAFQPPPPTSTASMAVPGLHKLLTENNGHQKVRASQAFSTGAWIFHPQRPFADCLHNQQLLSLAPPY